MAAVVDANGGLMSQQRYYPYGGVRSDVGTVTQTDFGYTGQRNLDAQGNSYRLGLMDYKARFYDAYLHHFIQPDSIIPDQSNPQALNRYSYALNNPIRYNDPTGHCIDGVTTIFCVFAAAMIGGAIVGGVVSAITQYKETGSVDVGQVATAAIKGALIGGGIVLAVATAPEVLATAGIAMGLAGSVAGWEDLANAGVDTLASSMTLSESLFGTASTSAPIIGNPQKTSDPRHALESTNIAEEFSQLPTATNVYLNKPISTITGGQVLSGARPDVAVEFEDGSYNFVEIVSQSQILTSQLEKMNNMIELLYAHGLELTAGHVIPK